MGAKESWNEEKQSAYLYRILADVERGTPRETLFRNLANMADHQALTWKKSIAGEPEYSPGVRVQVAAFLLKIFGPERLKPLLASLKIRGLSVYGAQPVTVGHDMPKTIMDVGHRHRITGAAGSIRAAVFGINDGLVSTSSLIVGVAAASGGDSRMVLISGSAGMLAGALSMASGEYISVRTQTELLEYQLSLERAELEEYPEEEAAELALIYEARGVPMEQAKELAHKLIQDKERALETLAREELGLDPSDLGSAWGAAVSSFFAFSVGGAIPLLPWVLIKTSGAFSLSIIASAVALFVTGAVVSLFSGRSPLWSGLRMLLIGGVAGVITHFIGVWVG